MVSEIEINAVVNFHNSDTGIVQTNRYRERGVDPLFPRLSRAALNQISHGPAMVSRYATWAETVRDNIIAALDESDLEQRRLLLTRAANSLSAFAEIQSLFDPDFA
jgi:hypothetical protein